MLTSMMLSPSGRSGTLSKVDHTHPAAAESQVPRAPPTACASVHG